MLWSIHAPPSEGPLWEGYTIRVEGCDATRLCVTPGEAEIDQTPDRKSQDEKTHLAKQPVSWSECEGRPHLMLALDMCWQTKARWQQEFVCVNKNKTKLNIHKYFHIFYMIKQMATNRSNCLSSQKEHFKCIATSKLDEWKFLKYVIIFWVFYSLEQNACNEFCVSQNLQMTMNKISFGRFMKLKLFHRTFDLYFFITCLFAW